MSEIARIDSALNHLKRVYSKIGLLKIKGFRLGNPNKASAEPGLLSMVEVEQAVSHAVNLFEYGQHKRFLRLYGCIDMYREFHVRNHQKSEKVLVSENRLCDIAGVIREIMTT